jgi:hypothetical protein
LNRPFSLRSGGNAPHAIRYAPLLLLVLWCASGHAQVAADERWRLVETLAAPWGQPLSPAWAKGTPLRTGPRAFLGPSPLHCARAAYSFARSPAAGLFEGSLPEPAQQSAAALGIPDGIVTQRVACDNGSFDLHRTADGRLWLALDNAVMRWERVSAASSPEATVQLLLLQHMGGSMAISRDGIAAQSAWLTQSLAKQWQEWFERTAQSDEVPALDGDPYTDSQESPETFTIAPARVRGQQADVTVTYDGSQIEPYPVHFLLKRASGSWRVDDLRFRDGELLTRLLAQ